MGLANQSATPGRTTLLEAVNICLAVIGEAPVNSLDGQQVGEAAQAERTLLEFHKSGQTQGWAWNRESAVTFVRDPSTDEFLIPDNVVQWAPNRLEWNGRFVARGGRVYDNQERTFSIPLDVGSIEADIVSLLPWDQCSEAYNRWTTIRAARVFANRAVGNTSTFQLTQQDEDKAWADLLRVDTGQSQPNAITGNAAFATFRPAMGLGRRLGSSVMPLGLGAGYSGGAGAGNGSVTSVGLSVPTGFAVSGSPITSSGSLILDYAPGYSLPTAAKQASWDLTVTRLLSLRDARRIYVSLQGDDSNNGTSPAEPLRSLAAAAAAAQPGDVVKLGPGTFVEATLPIRWRYDVTIFGEGLRSTIVQPAAGQEFNDIFKVDSGFWCWGVSFAGHQADSSQGLQSWAISFDELANNTARGAVGLGAFILKSPYIQNCTSITAEDDSGTAGSQSTGDTGGGMKVDGKACASNSPIRSMVVDSYTQVNLGGPGCLVLNDGYAQLVSFFGTFCTYHVKTLSGGQVNLSGGGTTDFGVYGLVASGYSPTPLYLGNARIAAYGAARIERSVTINVTTDVFASTAHGLASGDQVLFSASQGALPTGLTVGTTYFVIASGLTADAFKVSATDGGASIDMSGTATGTYSFVRQGQTQIDVIGFTPNRLGRQSNASRPNAGQLMFPQLVFPRDATTGVAGAKTFTYTRTGPFTLTYTEAASPAGPDHEYVSGGSATIGGTDYGVVGATYNKVTGVVALTTSTQLPGANGATGSVAVNGLVFICPTSAYIVTSSIPIDASGNTVANDSTSRAGYRVVFYSGLNGGLRNRITAGQKLDFRNRSQISAPSHTFEFVGSGTNYDALPWNGGVPNPANAIIEENNGRVYSSNTNEKGDFAVGSQFAVDGTTGSVTINTSQFNLSGLNFIGPFSRNGGISTVGVQLREVSNNSNLLASTGAPDGNTVPTQSAIKSYADNRFLADVTVTAGIPLTISDTSTQDAQGFWTRTRNIALSLNAANGLAQLDGSGLLPGLLLPDTGVSAGSYGSANQAVSLTVDSKGRVTAAANASISISSTAISDSSAAGRALLSAADAAAQRSSMGLGSLATQNGTFSGTSSGVNTGDQTIQLTGDVTGSGTGTFAATLVTNGVTPGTYTYATLTVDSKGRVAYAASGVPPSGGTVTAVTGTAPIVSSGGTTPAISISAATTSAAGSMSATDKAKLDGVATGATANSSDAYLLSRANHTGTQAASTITGLGTAATSAATAFAASGAVTTSGLTMSTARILARSSAGTGAIEEHTLPTGFDLSAGALRAPAEIGLACSDEITALTVGTGKVTFRMPYAMTLTSVRLSVTTAPTGSALIVDVKQGGASVFSTKAQIDASATTSVGSGTTQVISTSALTDNAVITVDITQIGSTVAGLGLKVWLIGRRA